MSARSICLIGAAAVLLSASNASAQSPNPQPSSPSGSSAPTSTETRPATPSVFGDTGLWFVPTGEVLPAKTWSFSLSRLEANDGEGFSNISTFPLSVGVGLGGHVELFGSWQVLTRVDRDARPLFFASTATPGDGGGIDVEYPLANTTFASSRGDLRLGGKVNFLSQADQHPVALALRAMVLLATGNTAAGTTSGATDLEVDAVVSREAAKAVELSGYGGLLVRGNPAGYTLTNGFRWGVGAAFPSRSPIRVTTELYGEAYANHTITAPAGLMGTDGSIVPISSTLTNPAYLNLGLTFQMRNGFFLGIGANWNVTMASRSAANAAFGDETFDGSDYQVRIGFHPGTRVYVAPPPPPPPPAPIAPPPPPPPPPVNRPPTVKASCDPCTVYVGQTSTVTADGRDPDGDTLTYQWRVNAGTLANPTQPQSRWTAPMDIGPVPFTVTVNDGHGGTASDTVTIQVIKPPVKTYAFEDVHFDFDRYNLRADALRVLDEAVAAMQADPTLTLKVEGHTCDIGTAEYNLALGERRAKAVSDYFVSRGISASRLSTVSYGEESPKYDNAREETRRLNRRAALVVTLQSGKD